MANVRIEFRPVGSTGPTEVGSLAVHRQNALGLPACGQPIKNWTDPKTGQRWNARPVPTDNPITCERTGCK
jgi:hypothetical protein